MSSSKVKLQSSNLIKSIREFPAQGHQPCCSHVVHYIMLSYSTVHDGCLAGVLVPGFFYALRKYKMDQSCFSGWVYKSRNTDLTQPIKVKLFFGGGGGILIK